MQHATSSQWPSRPHSPRHRPKPSVGRHSTTDSDQRSDPHEFQGFRIEPGGVDLAAAAQFHIACVIDGQPTQPFHLVQGQTPSFPSQIASDEITATLTGKQAPGG